MRSFEGVCVSSPLRAAVRSDLRSVRAAVAFVSGDSVSAAAAPPAVTCGADGS